MAEDPGDIQLVRAGADEGGEPPRRGALAALLVATAVVVALVAGYVVWRRSPASPTASTQPAPAAAAQPAAVPESTLLPALEDSDALVRELVRQLSSHPAVAAWLTTDGLIVNFVVVTTRIADGRPVAAELKPVGPIGAFRTAGRQGRTYVDPASYRRYDRFAEAVAALDAAGTARLYERLKPRIREAHQRFGASTEQADRTLGRAIDHLLQVPVVEAEIELVPSGIGYAYADPRLEALSHAQRQFLRMGPENVRVIQGKLREIRGHLGS